MTRRSFAVTPATAISVVLATMALAACGPGDNASSSAPQQSAPNLTANATDTAAATAAYANAGNAGNAASDTLAAAPASYASDPVQSAQASLAADSEQIAPVMSYAPGDEPPQTNSTSTTAGNDSRSTVTTSQ
jgi:hypothetical protein